MLRTPDEQPNEATMQASRLLNCTTDLAFRCDMATGPDTTRSGRMRGGLPPRILRRISEYVDDNIEQRIPLEMLAKIANLSVSYFVRAFKQSVGVTPHDYLVRRRVQLTMDLLLRTDMPLSEIAHAAGFADQSHCARRFRQHVGMSPRDYRWRSP
jgi:AraC family transcriptional regulator